MKSMWKGMAVAGLSLALACTWVPLDPGGETVGLRTSAQVGACERIGKTNTRTLGRVGPIPRREAKVGEELLSLARNEALRMGGNTVVPLSEAEDGEQPFGIYRCP